MEQSLLASSQASTNFLTSYIFSEITASNFLEYFYERYISIYNSWTHKINASQYFFHFFFY